MAEGKIKITYEDGESKVYSLDEAYAYGITPQAVNDKLDTYEYTDAAGNLRYTNDLADVPMKIGINKDTGNIKITAPKNTFDNADFQRAFDFETLKDVSKRYKTNPNYVLDIMETDTTTGERTEKTVSLEDYVSRINTDLENYSKTLQDISTYKHNLELKYGDKANNLTEEDLAIYLGDTSKGIYIPKVLFSVSSFGDNMKNPFLELKGKEGEDGTYSIADLKKVFTRDNFGRTELMGLIATLEGALQGSDWNNKEDYLEDDEGNKFFNTTSSKEAAKILAFKNYVYANHPEGSALQQIGDSFESLLYNTMHYTTRVYMNALNIAEAGLSAGSGHFFQNMIGENDKTMEWYNEASQLTIDSARVMEFFGMIGGTILGTKTLSYIGKNTLKDLGSLTKGAINLVGGGLSKSLGLGKIMEEAGEIASLSELAEKAADISRGAYIFLKFCSGVQKAGYAIGVAQAFMDKHKIFSKFVGTAFEFLTDTIHDALLYDSYTLRQAIESVDQDTKAFWLSQLADNATWWAGMSAIKFPMKLAGKTTLGKAIDAKLTPAINRIAAWGMTKSRALHDKFAGGDVVKKLREQIEKLPKNSSKRKRLNVKLQKELFNEVVAKARKDLADFRLSREWDGMKLTDDSLKEYQKLKSRVKALNGGIDRYNRDISVKVSEMINPTYDPATKKFRFINEDLGTANAKAAEFYDDLMQAAIKYDLKPADRSMLSQDMIDYMVGSYEYKLYDNFAKYSKRNAADAQRARDIIAENVADAKSRLPKEITDLIDKGMRQKIYQKWYAAQNQYGIAKGLLNKDKISSYEKNEIWAKIGYMPSLIEYDDILLEKTGRIENVIDQEMEKLTFRAERGQHYKDPEMVRQSRLRNMAKAEVTNELFKAYKDGGASATLFVQVTAEETEYVRKVKETKATFIDTIKQNASAQFKEGTPTLVIGKRRKPVKNANIAPVMRGTIVADMSPAEMQDLLVTEKVLRSRKSKLTDRVTEENYNDWFLSQSRDVQNYIKQQELPYREADTGKTPVDDATKEATDVKAPKDTKQTSSKTKAKKEAALEGTSYETFKKAMENGGDDFQAGLNRAYILGDDELASSSIMNEAARNVEAGKKAFYEGVLVAKTKASLRTALKVDVEATVDSIAGMIDEQIDNYVAAILEDPVSRKMVDTLSEVENGSEEFAKYIALRELSKKSNMDRAKRAIHSLVKKEIDLYKGKLKGDDIDKIYAATDRLFKDALETKLDDAAASARTINSEIVDAKSIYDKTAELNEKIKGAEEARENDDFIMYLDDEGRQVYAQVDPAFASLYNYRYMVEKGDASFWAKLNTATARMFRYGTTSVNLSSFGNQLYRDFGNALMVGGSWYTIKHNADNLVNVFGQDIVDQIKMYDPTGYEMKQIKALAKEGGQTIEEAAVSRELMKGTASASATTEATLYKEFYKNNYNTKAEQQLSKMKDRLQRIIDKPEEILNQKREVYLRQRVYASALNDALEQGYTLEQSRVFADFAMSNATTNFSRQLYHMQAIADSTPYFQAAINGSKSFWRMWSLDPVGITGRITGGLILPMIGLTLYSLSSEENRKIYKNIPEYDKDNNLVFVFGGKPISLPIPQEISQLVNPFRHFVEYLNDGQRNNFWELAMNDLIGIMPYDLSGFTAVDFDSMISDPTFFDRVGRGVSRLFSQVAPIPLKTAYMMATGIDPYSGKQLKDPRNNVYWNEDTGDFETLDYTQNAFAKVFAKAFKGMGMSPRLAEKIVSGIVGSTTSNLLGDVTALFTEGGGAFIDSVAQNVSEQFLNPYTISEYDLADSVWRRAVIQLTMEKESIIDSNEFKTLNNQLAQTTNPESRQKIISKQQTMVNEYQQRVADTVKNLSTKYNGTFDRSKFAAVLTLLNFNSDNIYQPGSQLSSNIASEAYYQGRNAAIHTMTEYGITGTQDASVFGYIAQDKETGRTVVKYNSPVVILDMKQQLYEQQDLHEANITSLIKRSNVPDAYKKIDAQIKAIRNKGKLTNADYKAIEAIQLKWDENLAKVIAPYVAKMTPEAAINSPAVLNAVYKYIEVPNSWEVNNKNKHVSLGDRGNKKKAYYESWVKKMFSVNDPYKGQY